MNKPLALLISLAILSLANLGSAQTLYWDGGTANLGTNGDAISQGAAGTWDNAIQNWDQGASAHIAWSSVADANFSASGVAVGAGLVTLGAPITANSLTVTTTNYVFTDAGNSANTFTVNSVTNSQTVLMSNNIVNATAFTKAGSGDLRLVSASSGLTAPLTILAGTLTLGNQSSAAFPVSFGDVAVSNGATLKLSPNAANTYAQNISGAGAVSVNANSSASSIILSGNNTFTGSVTINQATLSVASISDSVPNPLGLGTNLSIGAGASASIFTYTGGGDTTTRTITLGGTTPTTSITANGIYGPLTLLGPVAFANTNKHTLTLNGGSTYLNVFGGTISDNFNSNTIVAKGGAGIWMLTGSNTYSGGTTFGSTSGTLIITNDYALGAATGAVTFAGTTGATALKSANNDVTLGASRTVTTTGVGTGAAGFGGMDTNNFYIASFITGPGGIIKSGSSYSLGAVRFSNDTNNFTGPFTAAFGNTEFTSVADSGTASSLGKGITNAGAIILGNGNSAGTLRYVGTGNSATHRSLFSTATTGGYTLDNIGTGTIAYLNTTSNLLNGTGDKSLTLQGSNTGTNTLAQVINDNGGTTTLNKSGTGKWVLTGANTFSGTTTISGGTLSVSSDGNLGTAPVSATPNSLTLNGGALSASASFTLNANRGIALGPTGTNSLGNPATGTGTLDVASAQTLSYGGIIANNTTTNLGNLVKTGAGTLTLTNVNTYTGNTIISAGTLALSGSGSIADSTNIDIASGATLDMSGVGGGYTLASSQILVATNGATATINGSLSLGASAGLVIGYTNGTPTINVTGGALTLAAGNATTINVKGTALGAGNYKLISKGVGGSVTGTAPTSVTVSTNGLVTGATGSLSISNNELYLAVSSGTLYPPVIGSLGQISGQMVLSFSGTNGQSWKILSSTSLTVPLTNWVAVTNGTFTSAPVSYTNASPVDPQRFYIITSP